MTNTDAQRVADAALRAYEALNEIARVLDAVDANGDAATALATVAMSLGEINAIATRLVSS